MKKDGARVMMKPVVSSQMNKGGVHMKKRLISFVLAVTIIVSTSLPAFATKKFDMSVFDGREDVWMHSDEMAGETNVFSLNMGGDGDVNVYFDDGSSVGASATLFLTDSFDYYYLSFSRLGFDYMGLYKVIVKIGENRYTLLNFSETGFIAENGTFFESVTVPMKKELIPLMNDLVEHQDEEIKVRLVGAYENYDFSLTDKMKRELLGMYELYISGNGTRNKNLQKITDWDKTIVDKNGEVIDGHRDEKILRAVLEGVTSSL